MSEQDPSLEKTSPDEAELMHIESMIREDEADLERAKKDLEEFKSATKESLGIYEKPPKGGEEDTKLFLDPDIEDQFLSLEERVNTIQAGLDDLIARRQQLIVKRKQENE